MATASVLDNRAGREIVKLLAKPVVARVAAGEVEDFDEIADAYCADPDRADDETLGSGFGLTPDLVLVLFFVATTLDRLLGPGLKDRAWLRRLREIFGREPSAAPSESPFDPLAVAKAVATATVALELRLPTETKQSRELIEVLSRELRSRLLMNTPVPEKGGILFLGANPDRARPLRIDLDVHGIAEALRGTPRGSQIQLHSDVAVHIDDLHIALLTYRPRIVHFSGHGGKSGTVLVEGNGRRTREVTPEALSRLFDIFAGEVRLVVLMSCFSAAQATAMSPHVSLIALRREISDRGARSFSRGFYRALGYGESLQRAFALGCSQIELSGDATEADVPQMVAGRLDPATITLDSMSG